VAFIPSTANVNVLNPDGSQRSQKTLINGYQVQTAVSQATPIYQIITPGGDTQGILNFEYRIPLFGPITMAPFFDAGLNKIVFANQLKVNSGQIASLNDQFTQAAFSNKVKIAAGTQQTRISTGIEFQVILPIVQAPFRVYWAYNPYVLQQYLQPPVVMDRTMFPNQTTFVNAIQQYSPAYPYYEKKSTFRFTIGRTF
jgi:outer membrane protein insertion porin family